MKSGAFADVLSGVAKLMDATNASEAVEAICGELRPIFEVRPSLPVMRVLEQIDYARGRRTGGDPALHEFIACRNALIGLASTMPQKTLATDFSMLFDWLAARRDQSLRELIADSVAILREKERRAAAPSVQKDSVAAYVRRLENALSDAGGFKQVVAELEADSGVRVGEAKEIARAFVGAKGKSKREALNKIRSRYELLATQQNRRPALDSDANKRLSAA